MSDREPMVSTTKIILEMNTRVSRMEGLIEEGFRGVHQRQDRTNGRIQKAEDNLVDLEKDFHVHKESFIKLSTKVAIWSLIIGTVAGLIASKLIDKL